MLDSLPLALSIAFALITLITFIALRHTLVTADSAATRHRSRTIVVAVLTWLVLQWVLSLAGVYYGNMDALPPRIFLFGVLPSLVVIVVTFSTAAGRQFVDSLSLFQITLLHSIRILVEVVLWWLFVEGAVPEVMTFEGRNFDIIAGLTAPFVAYLGIRKNMLSRSALLIWNIICLGLLFNIVIIAVLAVASPIQRLAFEQPNTAVLYFPFSWLPTFVVPVVLFCHLSAIRKLLLRAPTR